MSTNSAALGLLLPLVKSLRRDVCALKYWHEGESRWTTAACRHEPISVELLGLHLRTALPDCPEALRKRGARGLYFLGAGIPLYKAGEPAEVTTAREHYKVNGSSHVMAACFDLDDKGGVLGLDGVLRIARRLNRAAARRGLKGSVWTSSGGNGAHIWFRWGSLQDAFTVMQIMEKVAVECALTRGTKGLSDGQVEIFPKQYRTSGPDELGNMVILPGCLNSRAVVYGSRDGDYALKSLHELAAGSTSEQMAGALFPLSLDVGVSEAGRPDWLSLDGSVDADFVSAQAQAREAARHAWRVQREFDELCGRVESSLEAELRSMLDLIGESAWDEYGEWFKLGAMLVTADPEIGAKLFHEYSAMSAKYDEGMAELVIDRVLRGNEMRERDGRSLLTLDSLRARARALGWGAASAEDFEGEGDSELDVIEGEKAGESEFEGDSTHDRGAVVGGTGVAGGSLALPWLQRDNQGRIEPSTGNLLTVLRQAEITGNLISLDTFSDEIVIRQVGAAAGKAAVRIGAPNGVSSAFLSERTDVSGGGAGEGVGGAGEGVGGEAGVGEVAEVSRLFTDNDYTRVKNHLENMGKGFKPIARQELRECVALCAEDNAFDSAKVWLEGLVWDGVSRCETFIERLWAGRIGEPYERAVSMYMWSALAARVMSPGCKVEMVPVLVGDMGARKSSGIAAIAPGGVDGGVFCEISFEESDDDLARRLKGALVVEIAELKGLSGRDSEHIKAFLSRQYEHWVPKYKEFAVRYPRRSLFFGSSNVDEFLLDPQGFRRWLPFHVGARAGRFTVDEDGVEVGVMCDTDGIAAERVQLWAEAREIYKAKGILFAEAERLARSEYTKFSLQNPLLERVEAWYKEYAAVMGPAVDYVGISNTDILNGIGETSLRGVHAGRILNEVMPQLGFTKTALRVSEGTGVRIRGWVRRRP